MILLKPEAQAKAESRVTLACASGFRDARYDKTSLVMNNPDSRLFPPDIAPPYCFAPCFPPFFAAFFARLACFDKPPSSLASSAFGPDLRKASGRASA